MSYKINENLVKKGESRRNNRSGKFKNVLRSFAGQGVALGFGDEIEAGVGAAYDKFVKGEDFTESYGKRVGKVRDINERFRETNPVLAYGSEAVGSLGSGALAVPKLLAKGAQKLGSKKLQKAAANQYVAPTVTSGIYGAGIGENSAQDRAANAAILAAASPVFQKAMNIVTPTISEAGKRVLKAGARATAPQLLNRSVAKKGVGNVLSDESIIGRGLPYIAEEMEQAITSLPGAGIGIGAFKTGNIIKYNEALIDDALEPIGKSLERTGGGLARGIGKVTDKYLGTSLLDSPGAKGRVIGMPNPEAAIRSAQDTGAAKVDFGVKDLATGAKSMIDKYRTETIKKIDFPTSSSRNIKTNVDDFLGKNLDELGIPNHLSERLIKSINKEMNGVLFKTGPDGNLIFRKASGENINDLLGNLKKLKKEKFVKESNQLLNLVDNVEKIILKEAPDEIQTRLRNSNKAYARIYPILDAVETAKDEIFLPSQYKTQVKRRLKGKPIDETLFANQLTQDMSELTRNLVPDTGSISRLYLQSGNPLVKALQSALAAGTSIAYANPPMQTALRNLPKINAPIIKNPVLQSSILDDTIENITSQTPDARNRKKARNQEFLNILDELQ